MVILRKLALRVQTNLGAHPREIKQATSLLETTFDSFSFHGASATADGSEHHKHRVLFHGVKSGLHNGPVGCGRLVRPLWLFN
jgi:hypothetical protein